MSFDLNIKNYQKNELVEMFGLPSIYDKDAIENNGNKLKSNIINNSKIGKEIKSKIILFLQEAKKILLEDTHDIRENVKKIIATTIMGASFFSIPYQSIATTEVN